MDMIPSSGATVRSEIAARAARLIAEDGMDYGSAKKKAAKEILGASRAPGQWMPDNSEIEDEVRAYQSLYLADTQPARLRSLRALALELMDRLQAFSPYLVGAAANGTAGDHSDIHLELYADSAKDVEIFLINAGIDIEVSEVSAARSGRAVELIQFMYRSGSAAEGVHVVVLEPNEIRGALRADQSSERLSRKALAQLLEKTQ